MGTPFSKSTNESAEWPVCMVDYAPLSHFTLDIFITRLSMIIIGLLTKLTFEQRYINFNVVATYHKY